MFGEKVDYALLRLLAHRRNLAAEESLDARAGRPGAGSPERAEARLRVHLERFEGAFPIGAELHYLDIGCGNGEICMALARMGCRHVTGVDNVPRRIKTSLSRAEEMGLAGSVQFVCEDIHRWDPPRRYDVVMSFSALEHIDEPGAFLGAARRFVADDGIFVLAFGPLFHSPFGDHMSGFFRVQIPWRGVLFSERAVLRLRREFYRPTDRALRYRDIVGGLNLMRYSEFLGYVRDAGWKFRFLSVNTFLRRFPPLYGLSRLVTSLPVVRDYFVHNVYAVLEPRDAGKPRPGGG